MKITAIKTQVKKKDRFSIYIDEEYSFSLNEYQLAESGLSVGKEITQSELDNLKSDSDFGKAYERVLNYLSLRPRSRKEIEDYLTRTYMYPKPKSYINKSGERVFKKPTVDKVKTNKLIERVLERLEAKGYLNDESFALAWAKSRQAGNKTSHRKLTLELKVKGISEEIISNTLDELEFDDTEAIRELVNKKRRLSRYQDDVKLTQFLLRQGFNYDMVSRIIKEDYE